MTDDIERLEAAYQEIARRMREWPNDTLTDRFRFGTFAIHVLPQHGISTGETEALYQRWRREHGAGQEA